MKTIKQLAKEALDAQNACNLCGVAQSFAKAMINLGAHCPSGTTERNTHPITIVWLDKMNSLAGIQSFVDLETSKSIDSAFHDVNVFAFNGDES